MGKVSIDNKEYTLTEEQEANIKIIEKLITAIDGLRVVMNRG